MIAHCFNVVNAAESLVFLVINAVECVFRTNDTIYSVCHLVNKTISPFEVNCLCEIFANMDNLADRFVLVVGEIERVEAVDHNLLELFAFAVIDIDLVGGAHIAAVPDLADFASGVVDFFIGLAGGERSRQQSHH